MPIEKEIRFLIPNEPVHRAIGNLKSLNNFSLIGASKENQLNEYFDTKDSLLRKSGAVLKVRTVGKKSVVIFKKYISEEKGFVSYLELFSALPEGAKRRINEHSHIRPIAKARKICAGALLKRQFAISTKRKRLLMEKDKARLELDVDHVIVKRSGKVITNRREVEVENINASARQFSMVCQRLKRRFKGKLRLCLVSKYEFGLMSMEKLKS